MADAVIDLDAVNPIVAASVAGRFAVVSLLRCREIFVGFLHSGAFIQVTQLNEDLRRKLQIQVQRLAAAKLSNNVLEIVQKILAA